MNTPQLLDGLHASLASAYPTRRALTARPGRVTCVVEATSGVFDPSPCDPYPFHIEVDVHVLAAGIDEQSVTDLPHHVEPVAALIRAAGYTVTEWRAGSSADMPEVVITAQAFGQG